MVLFGSNLEAVVHTNISIPDANDLINSNSSLIIIDVREDSEYCGALGHVAGAQNYQWNSGVLQNSYQDFSIDDEILLICHSGNRSNQAAEFLDSKGYLHVYDMLGGTSGWVYTYVYDTVGCVDTDLDGFNDDLDNCPSVYNPLQTDSDLDGIGNACDSDCPNLDALNPVSIADLAILTSNWQLSGSGLAGDLNSDEIVNIYDLILIAKYWLSECYEEL